MIRIATYDKSNQNYKLYNVITVILQLVNKNTVWQKGKIT